MAGADGVTLSYWCVINASATDYITNFSETEVWPEVMARTGVNLKFIHPANGQIQEQFNILMASGDLPDMISHQSPGYPGGLDACIDDGYILDLTDLVPEYCPNYMKAVKDFSEQYDENVLRSSYTGSGRIGAVGQLMQRPQGPWAGLYVRGDWLEDCELDTPETFEDWEEMLTAFKDKCGATTPMLLFKNGYDNVFNSMVMGFGVTSSWYRRTAR